MLAIIKAKKSCQLNKAAKLENKDPHSLRIYVLAFFVLALAGIIAVRLYFLQVISYVAYKALANDQHSIFQKLIPKRGEIFLTGKDGLYPVAVNKETKMAYAVPKEMENADEGARKIAEILGLDAEELKNKLGRPEDMYEVLKHRLSDEEISRIKELNLKGVHLADEDFRYYPAGELASNVLGFVGWKGQNLGGRYGTEAYFDSELKGREGNLFQNRDTAGRWISTGNKEINYSQDGDDLVLTLDHVVQYEAEKILKSAIEKYEADRGTVIVMEVSAGKILAMASYPNFDPNNYQDVSDLEAFQNLAVSGVYEPGSVFKTMTLAAAIDSGRISPDTTYVDSGVVKEAGYEIRNSDLKAYGKQTMTQVLEKSLNTGAIFAEKLLGNNNFSDYVKRFGFGEVTNIDLPGEGVGSISNLKNLKSDIQFFTASFGQGISVTPIQLVSAYNVIANGGILVKPQIVEEIIKKDGEIQKNSPQEIRRVISTNAAFETAQILRSVVVEGHGKRADVPGYSVVGKTGTAQVPKVDARGYEEGKTIGTFCGFAPMENPRFTLLVRMDNPKSVQWAESSAAPTFGEMMKFLLDYYNVEPTEKYTQKDLDLFNQTHDLRSYFNKKDEDKKEGKKL